MQSTIGRLIVLASAIASIVSTSAFGQITKITASDPVANDEFGRAVSVSGDTAFVGAAFHGDLGNQSGATYIFERDLNGANSWGEVTKLLAFDGVTGDWFGISVSIAGDRAVVGAPLDDTSAANRSGSAYVYARNQGGNGSWGFTAKLVADDAGFDDLFGNAVAISGDRIIIGAEKDDDLDPQSGSAYIFGRDQNTNTWSQITKINANDGEGNDAFGGAVAISGDWVVVGATGQNGLNSNAGAAYIFGRNEGGSDNWGLVTKLSANDGDTNDQFGTSVAISGDTAIVGAENNDSDGNNNSGSAYIFERNVGGANNWGLAKKISATPFGISDKFGISVSISGDQALVGASFNDDQAEEGGTAYLFARNQGGLNNWGQTTQLLADDGGEDDRFGRAVSISGNTALGGAFQNDQMGMDTGAAYIFQLQGPPTDEIFSDDFES